MNFRLWTGLEPDREVMRAALEATRGVTHRVEWPVEGSSTR